MWNQAWTAIVRFTLRWPLLKAILVLVFAAIATFFPFIGGDVKDLWLIAALVTGALVIME
jgi:hypothetical protein